MANRFWVGGTGTWDGVTTTHWSATSGGAGGASVPTSADAVFINGSSGGVGTVITLTGADVPCASLDCTGYTRTLDISPASARILASGSVTFVSGMTLTAGANSAIRFAATGTLTSAGKVLGDISISRIAGLTLSLGDDLSADTFTVSGGTGTPTFNANNKNVTLKTFSTSSVAITLTMGSGTWTITGSGSCFAVNAGCTVNANTSTIKFTDATSTDKTFDGGGKTYNNVWFTGAGTGAFILLGSNTFNDFKCDTPPHTIEFTAATTTTFTTFTVAGASGNLITINSVTAAAHNLSCSSGVINVPFASITNSHAAGGATFVATNSTDGGGNTGWSFAGGGDSLFFGGNF